MHIPAELAGAIERMVEGVPLTALAKAAESLSVRYRDGSGAPLTEMQRLAYAATRMPATYAALSRVLREVPFAPESVLDLGAGPGSSAWAVWSRWPSARVEAVEGDVPFIRLGRNLMDAAGRPFAIAWQHSDLRSFVDWAPRDLVVAAFALGEVEASMSVLRNAWQAARHALVVVEPGTPAGFARIRAYRDALIALGAFVAAPCPHAEACPVTGSDWCHFAQRVERSRLHRRLKAGALSWEDEKFSYIVATREPVERAAARVVRHPDIQSGFVRLELCTAEGLARCTVGRSERALFKRARKANWGDCW